VSIGVFAGKKLKNILLILWQLISLTTSSEDIFI